MNRSEQIQELAAALAKAQATIQTASKGKENTFFKSRYADLASVWEACRGPLSSNGLSVVQVPELAEGKVTVTTTLLHASGQFIDAPLSAPLKETTPQAIGSLITYLRRYSLSAMAGVAPDEDDDAEKAMGRGKGNGASAPTISPEDLTRIQEQTSAEFKEEIAKAADLVELEKIPAKVTQAHAEKRLSETQRLELTKPYLARKEALAPKTAKPQAVRQ